MKKLLWAAVLLVSIVGCRKEKSSSLAETETGLEKVLSLLEAQMQDSDYVRVNKEQFYCSRQGQKSFWRLGFKNGHLTHSFVLVSSDSFGNPVSGKIISLTKTSGAGDAFEGQISVNSLDRSEGFSSAIHRGYIESWHPRQFVAREDKAASFPVPYYDVLPEVVVVGVRSGGGFSWGDYLSFNMIFEGGDNGYGGGGSGGGFGPGDGLPYSPVSGGGGGPGSAGSGSSPTGGGSGSGDVMVDFDNPDAKPGINLGEWLQCFRSIPDEGSSSSITICGDVPVDDDPGVAINIYNGSTGHCFMVLKKTGSDGQSVSQVIGFTAQNTWQALQEPNAFVPGKLVDNGKHEYNGSLTMLLTPAGLNEILHKMELLAEAPYSLMHHDCLDYCFQVINSVRNGDPLTLPGDPASPDVHDHISTGQRFYEYLQDKVAANDADAPYIILGGVMHAGTSHGPCSFNTSVVN